MQLVPHKPVDLMTPKERHTLGMGALYVITTNLLSFPNGPSCMPATHTRPVKGSTAMSGRDSAVCGSKVEVKRADPMLDHRPLVASGVGGTYCTTL